MAKVTYTRANNTKCCTDPNAVHARHVVPGIDPTRVIIQRSAIDWFMLNRHRLNKGPSTLHDGSGKLERKYKIKTALI